MAQRAPQAGELREPLPPRAFLEMIMPEHEARTRGQGAQRVFQPGIVALVAEQPK